MSFLEKTKLSFKEITDQIRDYLNREFAQTGDVFSPASPFGQILSVMNAFMQLLFSYLEDAIVESNILTARKTRSIYGFARLAGHNPTRAISAEGTIKIKWLKTITDVNMTYAIINDKSKLVCENNNLPYLILINNESGNIKLAKTDNDFLYLKIVQGNLESQTRTGSGENLQSYNIVSKKSICNENVYVYVNGEPFEIVESLYDMKKGAKQCMVKTSLVSGIDVYFGNQDFGYIPPLGSSILVEYIITDGYLGNIFGKSENVAFKWKDKAITNGGEELDLNEYLYLELEKSIVLGSDPEPTELTKLIAPKTSRSFVLANPDNYINLLSRFNYSFVDAYITADDEYIDDNNVIYLYLIPDIKRRLNTNIDYFTTNIKNFYLDEDEKFAIDRYIARSGRQLISTELMIKDPVPVKYVMNVFIRLFDSTDIVSCRGDIVSKVADYLLNVTRRDKIPKSDIVTIIEKIKGIDSVSVSFVSERNESAILNGYYYQDYTTVSQTGLQTTTTNKIIVPPNTDPNLGLDEFGDIVIGKYEQPLFRGGWYDRFNNYYEDGISTSVLSSINIVVKDVIKTTVATQQIIENKSKL